MAKLEPIKFRICQTEVDMNARGVVAGVGRDRGTVAVEGARRLPDVVGELCRRLPLSRATIVRILKEIDNLDQVRVNPSVFIDQVQAAVERALSARLGEGIVYTSVGGERWRAEFLGNSQRDGTVFALASSERGDFLKLPGWFVVATPLGNYHPDWAVVRGGCLYVVREIMGADKVGDLQWGAKAGRSRSGGLP
jgi:type III restriction enzyme